jgi:hypothetical protein
MKTISVIACMLAAVLQMSASAGTVVKESAPFSFDQAVGTHAVLKSGNGLVRFTVSKAAPTTGSLNFSWSLPSAENARICLYTLSGKLIEQIELDRREGTTNWSAEKSPGRGILVARIYSRAFERISHFIHL